MSYTNRAPFRRARSHADQDPKMGVERHRTASVGPAARPLTSVLTAKVK
jgi:hypothetical protein